MMADDENDNQSQQPIPGSVVFGEGNLCIKLKFPKIEQAVLVEEDIIKIGRQRNDLPRVCTVCNKGFGSGKALGGHMRVHVQGYKDSSSSSSLKKLKPNHKPYAKKYYQKQLVGLPGTGDETPTPPTCSICFKNFPSMKSLFGHMRCHPERQWRGIQPPPPPAAAAKNNNRNYSSSSSVLDLDAGGNHDQINSGINGGADADADADAGSKIIDLTRSLPCWSVTSKRGCKGSAASTGDSLPVKVEEEEERMRDAVEELLMLAQGGDTCESGLTAHKNKHKHKHKQPVEAVNSNSHSLSLTNKHKHKQASKIEDKHCILEFRKRRIEEEEDQYPAVRREYCRVKKLKIDGTGSTTASFAVPLILENRDDKGKGKALLETNYSPEKWVSDQEKYYKNFTDEDEEQSDSMTRPVMMMMIRKKRKKMNLRDLNPADRNHTHSTHRQIGVQFSSTVSPPTTKDKYKCSTCNKCFPTHQALGGHRSSHNKHRNANHHNINMDESSSPAAVADEDEYHPSGIMKQIGETKDNEGDGSSSKVAENEHQCTTCGKCFPTGQALGGHKRCHYTGLAEKAPPSQLVGSPGEASQTVRKVLDFDLNEVPPMEEEEEEEEDGNVSEQAGGFGNAATSSHDSVA